MVDTAESTEIKVEREQADVSIRDALQQQLSGESTDEAEHEQTAVEVEDEEQEAEGIAEEATEAIPKRLTHHLRHLLT
jgi:hypothetical protein